MSDQDPKRSNNIWGERFTRTASIIFLVAVGLALGRYIYLKSTDQYPSSYEEQELIQYPHLEELQRKSAIDSNARDTVLQDARSRQ